MKLRYKAFFTIVIIVVCTVAAVHNYTQTALENEKNTYPLKYTAIVEKYSHKYGIEPSVVYATILCESGFDADAVSPKNALGLMQITQDTFEWLCTKTGEDSESLDIMSPEVNIRYGTLLLSMLYEEFDDADVAHAAYNAGRARIKSWMKDERYYKDGALYHIPFEETRNYVGKIKRSIEKYRNILEVTKNERAYV